MCSLCVFITDLCFGSAVGKVGGNGILRGHSKNCTWKLRGWWKCCTGETLQWLRVKLFTITADKFLGGTKVTTPAKFFGRNCHSKVVVHDPCPSFFSRSTSGWCVCWECLNCRWPHDNNFWLSTSFGSFLIRLSKQYYLGYSVSSHMFIWATCLIWQSCPDDVLQW